MMLPDKVTRFVVNAYTDQIREKHERFTEQELADGVTYWMGRPHDRFFLTMEEAQRYVIDRAEAALLTAEDKVAAARKRLAKCREKFSNEEISDAG